MQKEQNLEQQKKKKARKKRPKNFKDTKDSSGLLKIGDQWNAITIIALSQSNPLKAIAEFVENSIDAKAKNITIFRGKESGSHYLRIVDDGNGIPQDEEGIPNFKYVATHICDSIKRRMKVDGAKGIQGEFGIGLLSFWTVGEELLLRSSGKDGKTYQMSMRKGDSKYSVRATRSLLAQQGTELQIWPLLPGLRQFSGEKLQWYLASELRNRILESGAQIRIIDRTAKTEYLVEPRKFQGRRIQIPDSPEAQAIGLAAELYLDEPKTDSRVSIYRLGTRVLDSVSELEELQDEVWTSGYIQGFLDCPKLNLTPGTRLGIIRDEAFSQFCRVVELIKPILSEQIGLQQNAEEARASRNTLISLQKAFKEAFQALPAEEYDWLEIRNPSGGKKQWSAISESVSISEDNAISALSSDQDFERSSELETKLEAQPAFFEFPGPLYSVRVAPASTLVPVNGNRAFRAVARDRKGKAVHERLKFQWTLTEGGGGIAQTESEIAQFTAPSEPGLTRVNVKVTQDGVEREGFATVTVTDTLVESKRTGYSSQGLPGYTFQRATGESWRSRFDEVRNLVVVNNGHRDFVYAARGNALKLRYLCRLFTKELVMRNFPGISPSELLERLIEVSLYAEENL